MTAFTVTNGSTSVEPRQLRPDGVNDAAAWMWIAIMTTLAGLGAALRAHAARRGFNLQFQTFTTTTPGGLEMPALVTITVTDPMPILTDDKASTPANTPINITVLANDTDPLGRTLNLTGVQSPTAQGGTATINADGVSVDYTPPTNFIGSDTFTYDAAPV